MEISSKDIIFELVNTESNQEILQERPHREIGDLSVIYKFLVSETEDGRMTLPITNDIAKDMNISEQELFEVAYKNTDERLSFSIKSMREMLIGMMFPFGEMPENDPMVEMMLPPEGDPPMYVMTSSDGIKGACCILYSDKLGDFADKVDSDLVILPSSIHEVIILPKDESMEMDNLKNMVNEINMGVVSEEDRLSNNIFVFDRAARELKPVFDNVPSISEDESIKKSR